MKGLRCLKFILIAVSLIPYCHGCKKADESPPVLTVTHPYDGQEFKVGDSINVSVTITSASDISSVKISLVNDQGIPMLVPKYFFPGTKQYEFDCQYPINEDLESSSYTLLVSATNSYQTARVFNEILITGPGRYFIQLIAVCQPNTLKTLIYSIDAEGNQENIMSFDHGYKGSDISSGEQQFYFLRPSPDIMFAFNLDKLEADFQVEASPPHPQFNSLHYYDETSLVYLTNRNGEIRGFNRNGIQSFITPARGDTIPMSCWLHENVLYAYGERIGGPEKYMLNYFLATGDYYKSKPIDFSVLDSYSVTVFDDVLVFGNKDGESVGHYYSITDNAIHGEFNMPVGKISQVEKITQFSYFLSALDGIYQYHQPSGVLNQWKQGVMADVMAYDDLREILYVAEGSKLSLYRVPGGGLIQELELPYTIVNLHIHYNQ